MNYLTRNEIDAQLENQFSELRIAHKNKELSSDDVKNLLFSENDICDNIDPNSGNYQYAREKQHGFYYCEIAE